MKEENVTLKEEKTGFFKRNFPYWFDRAGVSKLKRLTKELKEETRLIKERRKEMEKSFKGLEENFKKKVREKKDVADKAFKENADRIEAGFKEAEEKFARDVKAARIKYIEETFPNKGIITV